MKLRLSTDLLAGVLFLGLGLAALIYGFQYPLGTTHRMGAGYFPRVISIGLMVMGTILVFRPHRGAPEMRDRIAFRPLIFILLGTLAFGLLVQTAGLLIAGVTLIVLARLGSTDFRPVEVLVLAVTLGAATSALFIYGLGLPLSILPRW